MSIHKFLASMLLMIVLQASLVVFANEGEKAAAAGEGKPEGKEEEKAKKELPEWVEIQTQLSTLESKINQKKEAIDRLIEEKHHLPANSHQVKSVIDEMVSEHKEMTKMKEEFDKKLIIFRFRYPERGAKEDRKYGHIEVKSLEQMEQELGVDGRLNRNIKKMRSQYQSAGDPTKKVSRSKEDSETTKAVKTEDSVPQKSIDESGTIILKK